MIETNEMLGMVQLYGEEALNDLCELDYTLGKIFEFAFIFLPVHRIEAEVVTENKKSLKSLIWLMMELEEKSYKYQNKY